MLDYIILIIEGGYIMENNMQIENEIKEIIALSDMETGNVIPYLLIKINDWVRQVRSTSKRASAAEFIVCHKLHEKLYS
jgi:hypothetical protein